MATETRPTTFAICLPLDHHLLSVCLHRNNLRNILFEAPMIVPITVSIAGSSDSRLPPQFAQFGADEVVLVEMQGALDVEGNPNGQMVGKLTIDTETVSIRRVFRFP